MKLVGHRGASGEAPENTLEAIKLAWEQGAQAAECDIMLTKDREVILMHDDSTKRTTAGQADWLIKDTLWKDLQTLEVGSFKAPQWKGVKIPRLGKVLQAIPADKKLFVEIKTGDLNEGINHNIIEPIKTLLTKYHIGAEKVIFISFDHEIVLELKKALPSYQGLLLTSYLHWPGAWPYLKTAIDLENYISFAKANNLDGLDMEISEVITKEWIARIHEAGLLSCVWSYGQDDTFANAQKYKSFGVDYFTTNYPGEFLKRL